MATDVNDDNDSEHDDNGDNDNQVIGNDGERREEEIVDIDNAVDAKDEDLTKGFGKL